MSVLAVSDLLFSDLLSKLNIKPWWEKFRGYCFAASVASALFATYIILLSPITINCTPLIRDNVSSILDFSTTQAFLINNYCSNQIPCYVNYAGIIPLVCLICILAASIWWLQIPGVIGAFRAFSEAFENMTIPSIPTEKCGFWSEHSHKDGELSNNRKTCDKLLEYGSLIDVDQCYFIRNVVLLCITLLSAVVSVVLFVFLAQDDNNFECSLDIKDERKIFGTTKMMRLHFCSHNTSQKLIPFMLFSSFSLIAQVFFILINIYNTHSNKSNVELDNLSAKASKAYRCCALMINFWKNASPLGYKPLSNFIDYLFNRALLHMSGKVEHAILAHDEHMIRFYSSIKKNGGNDVIEVKNDMIQKMFVKHKSETERLENQPDQEKYFDYQKEFAKKLSCIKFPKWNDHTKKLAKFLHSKKQWIVFVELLNAFIVSPEDDEQALSSAIDAIDCDLNSFTLTDQDAGGASILYYALDIPIYRLRVQELINIKFHHTAIRYILKLTKKQENIVIYSINHHIKKINAEEYVYNRIYISSNTKDELCRILKENTVRSPTPTTIPTNQSNEEDNIAGPSSAGNSSQEVRPQASHNTTAHQEEEEGKEDDLQDSRSLESAQITNDCVVFIVSDPQNSTSSKSAHNTNDCQKDVGIGPHYPRNSVSEQATSDCQEVIKDDPQDSRGPESAHNTNDCSENIGNDSQDSTSPESAYTMIDCQEVIEDDSQDFKSSESAHTTNNYPEDIGDGPQDSSSPELSPTTNNSPEDISDDPQAALLGKNIYN